jgi:hypothetical protein
MSAGPGPQGARAVASAEEYERRLRAAMRLMRGATRDAVAREVRAGIDGQVAAAGGDFARVAPTLDDPDWVGRQMVDVYGVAGWVKGAAIAVVALLALASVPGFVLQPAEAGAAVLAALLAFAALIAVLFVGALRAAPLTAAIGAGTAAALRTAAFFVPQGGISPAENATGGEFALFMVATALLVLVAVVPALAMRRRAADEE